MLAKFQLILANFRKFWLQFRLLLVTFGYFWLLRASMGYFCLLLTNIISFWLLLSTFCQLATFSYFVHLSETFSYLRTILATFCYFLLLLATIGYFWLFFYLFQKLKHHQKWNVIKTKIPLKLIYNLSKNVTKNEISPELKCHQNWNVPETKISLRLKYHRIEMLPKCNNNITNTTKLYYCTESAHYCTALYCTTELTVPISICIWIRRCISVVFFYTYINLN